MLANPTLLIPGVQGQTASTVSPSAIQLTDPLALQQEKSCSKQRFECWSLYQSYKSRHSNNHCISTCQSEANENGGIAFSFHPQTSFSLSGGREQPALRLVMSYQNISSMHSGSCFPPAADGRHESRSLWQHCCLKHPEGEERTPTPTPAISLAYSCPCLAVPCLLSRGISNRTSLRPGEGPPKDARCCKRETAI